MKHVYVLLPVLLVAFPPLVRAHFAVRVTSTTPIEGLPGWASTPCSDTDTANTYEFQATMPVETSDAGARLMLQGFLVDRFKLAFHRETRTRPIYALVVAPQELPAS